MGTELKTKSFFRTKMGRQGLFLYINPPPEGDQAFTFL